MNEPSAEVEQVRARIASMSWAEQRRIAVIADLLRTLLARDTSEESMLAFTLVLAEISA